jgi:hypothetical protein
MEDNINEHEIEMAKEFFYNKKVYASAKSSR